MHGIRTHVGDQRHRTFVAELDALIEFLCERHRSLRRVAQAIVGSLLQFGSCERRWRIALFFFLRDACDLPLGFADGSNNLVRGFLILYFDIFAFVLEELGFEERRLPRIEHRVNGPIFLWHESPDCQFAFDDQPQRHRLHAPGGKAAAHLVPQNRRNLVAHNAIEHAAGLLRIHQVRVDLPGFVEGRADGLGRNFVERNTKDFLRINGHWFFFGNVLRFGFDRLFGFRVFLLESGNAGFLLWKFGRLGKDHGEVRRNGLTLAIWIARQIDRVGRVRRFAKIANDLAFAGDNLQRGLKYPVVIEGDDLPSRLFLCLLAPLFRFALLLAAFFLAGQANADRFLRQVHDVSDGRFDGEVATQILVNRFRLCGRFDNDERTCHVAFVTPYCSAEWADRAVCVLLATVPARRWLRQGLPIDASIALVDAFAYSMLACWPAMQTPICFYNKTLLNCLPGSCRMIPFISRLKSVARTSEEFKPERSTMSSMGFGSSALSSSYSFFSDPLSEAAASRFRCSASGCSAWTSAARTGVGSSSITSSALVTSLAPCLIS